MTVMTERRAEMKFSENVAALQPSATLAVSAKVRQMIAEGKDVLDLCVGEPDFPTLASANEAGIRAIQNGKTRYTPAAGADLGQDDFLRMSFVYTEDTLRAAVDRLSRAL